MKKWTLWMMPFLLAAVIVLNVVPASAADTVAGFSDIYAADYYADAVEWAKETGITNGTGGGKFSPKDTVTRGQAVAFLWRAAGKPEPKGTGSRFTDVASNAYYYKPVLWATEQGITKGTGKNMFSPNGTLPYDQILSFLCRAAGGSSGGSNWSAAAVNWAAGNGLTKGLQFGAKANCPRSDVVYFLWRQYSSAEPEEPEKLEVPNGLDDTAAVTAAIVNGFADRATRIDVSAYHMEVSALSRLAIKIADTKGKNLYGVWTLSVGESKDHEAETIYVVYAPETTTENKTESEADRQNTEVREKAQEIVDDVVTAGMSEYDIVKALHDYLVLNCEYDMRLYSGGMPYTAYTAYGALKDRTAVCAGYAKAYYELLQCAGIGCEYVTGNTTAGYHAWNVVEIDGEWYHVDTTWDDPIPDQKGYIRYDYFLRSDTAIRNDHLSSDAKHSCTSTKYDRTTLPDAKEQVEQQEREEKQKEEQKRLEPILKEVTDICLKAMSKFPYKTAEELQAAPTLTSNDVDVTISLPQGKYSASDLYKIQDRLKEAIAAEYPDYELSGFGSSSVRIKRNDVAREIERRRLLQQADLDAKVSEIEKIIQEGIRNSDYRAPNYQVPIPKGYTFEQVAKACRNMNVAGYSFDGYTAGTDYSIGTYTAGWVTVNNLRYDQWEEDEIQRHVEIIQEAIRNREPEAVFQVQKFPGISDGTIPTLAVGRVKQAGYSFDGLTSGVDFVLGRHAFRKQGAEFFVEIEYPNQTGG